MWPNRQNMIQAEHACHQEVTSRSLHTIIAALAEQDMFFNDRHKTLNNRVIILLELAIFASTSSPLIQLISVLRRDQSDLLERLHVGGRGYP